MSEQIVGHKTKWNAEERRFEHEPLTAAEGKALWKAAEAAEHKRAADMPTERDAIHGMWSGYQRLRELGWREAIYCPKDGTVFDSVEPGSTGIHDCHYSGEWPNGHWWVSDGGDLWPSHPVLFRLKQEGP